MQPQQCFEASARALTPPFYRIEAPAQSRSKARSGCSSSRAAWHGTSPVQQHTRPIPLDLVPLQPSPPPLPQSNPQELLQAIRNGLPYYALRHLVAIEATVKRRIKSKRFGKFQLTFNWYLRSSTYLHILLKNSMLLGTFWRRVACAPSGRSRPLSRACPPPARGSTWSPPARRGLRRAPRASLFGYSLVHASFCCCLCPDIVGKVSDLMS